MPLIWPARNSPRTRFGFKRRPSARADRRNRTRSRSRAGRIRAFSSPGMVATSALLDVLGQRGGDAVRIDRVVVEPFRLQENLVPVALAEARRSCPRSTGNSAGRGSRSGPNTSASGATFARMISCVAAVVRVMPHSICGLSIRAVRNENGSGGSSPGCISSDAQSMVVPSRRGGVPVLSRPSAKPSALQRLRRAPCAGRLADAAGRRSASRRYGSGRAGRCRWSAPPAPHTNLAAVRQTYARDPAVAR